VTTRRRFPGALLGGALATPSAARAPGAGQDPAHRLPGDQRGSVARGGPYGEGHGDGTPRAGSTAPARDGTELAIPLKPLERADEVIR
jgi:hypothetical protein